MKIEEAIKILENEMPSCGDKLTFTSEELYEAYQMAIDALRKQIPEQPPEQSESEIRSEATEDKPTKKVYAISYKQFFFGNHYDRYIQFIETEDIFHEVGVLIYKASTAVKNIRWCKLSDESVEAAIERHMNKYTADDWKRIEGTNILRFVGKE